MHRLICISFVRTQQKPIFSWLGSYQSLVCEPKHNITQAKISLCISAGLIRPYITHEENTSLRPVSISGELWEICDAKRAFYLF